MSCASSSRAKSLVRLRYDYAKGRDLKALTRDALRDAMKGGPATGPSPVDRAKAGSKHHLIVEAHGIPLAAITTGGAATGFATTTFLVGVPQPLTTNASWAHRQHHAGSLFTLIRSPDTGAGSQVPATGCR